MLGNDRKETASTAVTSTRRRNDIEKFTTRTHRHFVDFESQIHVEVSKSNRCHNFLADLSFKIDGISKTFHVKFQRRIDGKSTKMCPLGIAMGSEMKAKYIREDM